MTLGSMALQRMRADFLNSRIVFWEDDCSEFSNEVATLTLDGASAAGTAG